MAAKHWTHQTLANLVSGVAQAFRSAGAAITIALSMNSATAAGKAVSASATQATTARTSGTMDAYYGTTTSLAGDSGGTYTTYRAGAPTDGGGSATHQAMTVEAGYDAWADLSACATGEADVVVGDNLASALQVREAANAYLTVVTTNNDERLEFGQDVKRVATARDRSHELRWEIHDDMFGKADTEVDHAWILNSGTDAQAIDPAIDTAQAGGVWQLVTGDDDGTTAVDASQMVWADLPIQLDSLGGDLVLEARVRIKTAITNVAVFFGLTDSTSLEEPFTNASDTITSTATDGAGFLYDTSATTDEWWGVAVDSDTDDTGNATTGTAPTADTWQILRMEVSSDGATIRFYIDGTLALTLSGAAGCGDDVVLYPTLIACGDGTASKTVDVDWVRAEGVR